MGTCNATQIRYYEAEVIDLPVAMKHFKFAFRFTYM